MRRHAARDCPSFGAEHKARKKQLLGPRRDPFLREEQVGTGPGHATALNMERERNTCGVAIVKFEESWWSYSGSGQPKWCSRTVAARRGSPSTDLSLVGNYGYVREVCFGGRDWRATGKRFGKH